MKVPAQFRLALAASAGLFVFVGWDQSHWWRTDAEYAFGWLTPAFVAFIAYDRWGLIRRQLADCAAPSKPMAPECSGGFLSGLIGTIALAFGAALFIVGALSRARNGATVATSLGIALGAAAMALACIYLCAPVPESGRTNRHGARRLAGLFIFPVGIWLLSAPLIDPINDPLRLWLMHWVVGAAAFIFRLLHLPIFRHGNIFSVRGGEVEVTEACIGIRSLTGLSVISLFLGSAFLPPGRRPLLFAFAVAFALCGNLFRVLFLNLWAYWHGPAGVTGRMHDTAGWIAIGMEVAALLVLVLRWSGGTVAPTASRI